MTTVRAAVVNDFGSEWSVENVALDDSTLGPTDVLVSMRAAGLCHTDEHIREGASHQCHLSEDMRVPASSKR